MKKKIAVIAVIIMVVLITFGALKYSSKESDNKVLIFTASTDPQIQFFTTELKAKFPDYDIELLYTTSGNQASRLAAEGSKTPTDILYELDFGYAHKVEPYLADLSDYDFSRYVNEAVLPGKRVLATERSGCSIVMNLEMLKSRGLDIPASYEDFLKPEYKGLVSMPNPVTSGTGYAFLYSLVKAWGEERAFAYFAALSENILSFTSSGSGPINAIIAGEAAIGFAMTAQAVTEINNGVPLTIFFFEEGSPYSFFGMGMIEGKQNRKAVRDVFNYLYDVLIEKDKELFFPEKIFKDKDFVIANYPTYIPYADMTGNTQDEKERLLEIWRNRLQM